MNKQESNVVFYKYCPFCGNNVEGSRFCTKCGKKVNEMNPALDPHVADYGETAGSTDNRMGEENGGNVEPAHVAEEGTSNNHEKANGQPGTGVVIGVLSVIAGLLSFVLPVYVASAMGSTLNMSIVWAIQNAEMEEIDYLILVLFGLGLLFIIIGICTKNWSGAITGGVFALITWLVYLFQAQSGDYIYGFSVQYGTGFYSMLLSGIGGIVTGILMKPKS